MQFLEVDLKITPQKLPESALCSEFSVQQENSFKRTKLFAQSCMQSYLKAAQVNIFV